MTVAQVFGDNLTRLRERSGLTQEEVALRASLHRTEVSQLERGLRHARIDTIAKLAGAVRAEPAEFFEGIAWEPAQIQRGHFTAHIGASKTS
jgi:transcriptional regulator with XRE-family HTH domain